ncbi:hypothetical protein CEXT_51451 [Caerostris extrusa]|uniref:Uncharacterized protein n=1 Tax=Caerostris extrusa TaxID=172846 RepID=A0AAV4N447_CAEEX|nr:hypothetical protein CEXT_51451 [Caerostris extrusa]
MIYRATLLTWTGCLDLRYTRLHPPMQLHAKGSVFQANREEEISLIVQWPVASREKSTIESFPAANGRSLIAGEGKLSVREGVGQVS